jgi:hypothetical protein
MVGLGFARELKLDIDLPPALQHVQPRSFSRTEAGRTAMSQLLTRVSS